MRTNQAVIRHIPLLRNTQDFDDAKPYPMDTACTALENTGPVFAFGTNRDSVVSMNELIDVSSEHLLPKSSLYPGATHESRILYDLSLPVC